MVPENLAGSGSRRGVRIPPHDKHSARQGAGLEAAIIDQSPMRVSSLDGDGRSAVINVAGPAALLVPKLHKLGERVDPPDSLDEKDAHDIYRLLVATETSELAETIRQLLTEDLRGGPRPEHSSSSSSSLPRDQMRSDRRWRAEPKRCRPAGHRLGVRRLPGPGSAVGAGPDRSGLLNRVGPGP